MKLSLNVSRARWTDQAKTLVNSARIDAPVGTIEIYRGPSGYPRVEGMARTSENWSLRLGERELLTVQGLAAPGYPARATAKSGLKAILCGRPGRLAAQRSLHREERFVRFGSPDYGISAVKQPGRYAVLDTRDGECAAFRRGHWTMTVPSEEACAFVALMMAASLEDILATSLVHFLP